MLDDDFAALSLVKGRDNGKLMVLWEGFEFDAGEKGKLDLPAALVCRHGEEHEVEAIITGCAKLGISLEA